LGYRLKASTGVAANCVKADPKNKQAKMRLTRVALTQLERWLDTYSQFNPSPLSIKQFIDFGRQGSEKTSFSFLKKEIPVRLANIIKEIHLLPENLLQMPSVSLVQNWYMHSFKEVLEFHDKKADDENVLKKFCENLVLIRNRHSDVVQVMAQGIMELKESHQVDQTTERSIQYFLDRFYMSRISIRMLISQHTLLFGTEQSPGRHIGSLDPNCDVASVMQDAYDNARFLCDQYYLTSPELNIKQHNPTDPTKSIQIVYVPSHLYHILFELFKNSLRAVVEHHGASCTQLPPIEALIVTGKDDISIKISDRGGGISRNSIDLLFQYMYSTAPQPPAGETPSAPLAGYGYGLPLSRLYAKYFQGDLILTSCEGYGTDAIIYLKALTNEANELLPVFNKTSSKQYTLNIPTSDWSSNSGGILGGRNGASSLQHNTNRFYRI
jgi:pyruvate dehydrogenase kinase 2/3/4